MDVRQERAALLAGIDVGSTTVKLAVLDAAGAVRFQRYRRHHADLEGAVDGLLAEAIERFGEVPVRIGMCGSGAAPMARAAEVAYVQEVVANAAVVCAWYPEVRTAVELGGQDAKLLFFSVDPATGDTEVDDMRMNGSCAGGTGSFIDEVSALLGVPVEALDALAARGQRVLNVSGRCGVFAKTDIQTLLAAGATREDLALSVLHAVAKQTIGGLSQGLELSAPLLFEGGPLTYNATLRRVFLERLGLDDDQAVVPEHPETIVACGAALAAASLAKRHPQEGLITFKECRARLRDRRAVAHDSVKERPLFESAAQRRAFFARHHLTDPAETCATTGVSGKADAEVGEAADPAVEPCVATGVPGKADDARLGAPTTAADAHPAAPIPTEVYVGVDSGSTTSKVVMMGEDGALIETFYAPNGGDALRTVVRGLGELRERCRQRGIEPVVCGLGTTGYGELLMASALGADCHEVETVAHAQAALACNPEVSFILDIGGQDMKGIWVRDGMVSDILLNEACSSGCGSFLQTFAASLGVAVEDIAREAFSSENPARLGSRCTVFMNSSIITEQRAGKGSADILAGLCRSIVLNVFTKVIRVENPERLGPCVMVQGGTFKNAAVLRALEEYLGHDVVLAPHPGEMGAWGAALLAQRARAEGRATASSFIGFDAAAQLSCVHHPGVVCGLCQNNCRLEVVAFSTGARFVTGNRCERGERAARDLDAPAVERETPARAPRSSARPVDLMRLRERLAFPQVKRDGDQQPAGVVGIPRVLEFWESAPFWQAFFTELGYEVVYSRPSDQELFESGLRYVASDTVCLPAKLAHGHVLDLMHRGVDRVFFPHMMHLPPEGVDQKSPYTCAILMGYPTVVRNTQDPEDAGVRFDAPVFHWFSERDRARQVIAYAQHELGASGSQAKRAFALADEAYRAFKEQLVRAAERVRAQVRAAGGFAVVVAGRPYQTDPFVSHRVSEAFVKEGVPVLTVDSLAGLDEVDLVHARIEITNDFHTRMLAGAYLAAAAPELEYVQVVSFGCGHDAVLSDEITRIMHATSDKTPLVLKMDESQAAGSLGIRIKSFISTVRLRREAARAAEASRGLAAVPDECSIDAPRASENLHVQEIPTTRAQRAGLPCASCAICNETARAAGATCGDPTRAACTVAALPEIPDPYPVKFVPEDLTRRTLIIPNISKNVSILLDAVLARRGFTTKTVPVGGVEEVALGKRYSHNDICFPCQMVIGELIGELVRGDYDQDAVAVGMVKFQCDCRMSHYAALLRKALDEAGFDRVPVITTDMGDAKGMHPGVGLFTAKTVIEAVWLFMMLDILTELKRTMAPYELVPGEVQGAFDRAVASIAQAGKASLRSAIGAYRQAIDEFSTIRYDRSHPRPRVFVTGELLVTYHEGSNFAIEEYLERHGMEPVFPRVTDQLRKDFLAAKSEIKDFKAHIPPDSYLTTALFDAAQRQLEGIARKCPAFVSAPSPEELYEGVSHIMPKTLSCGEGWLMAGEIAHFADEGVRSFVILQPFGCLPNHVCGRGVMRRLKEEHPGIQILPLDLDPDTSFANVENRLQMLIMTAR